MTGERKEKVNLGHPVISLEAWARIAKGVVAVKVSILATILYDILWIPIAGAWTMISEWDTPCSPPSHVLVAGPLALSILSISLIYLWNAANPVNSWRAKKLPPRSHLGGVLVILSSIAIAWSYAARIVLSNVSEQLGCPDTALHSALSRMTWWPAFHGILGLVFFAPATWRSFKSATGLDGTPEYSADPNTWDWSGY